MPLCTSALSFSCPRFPPCLPCCNSDSLLIAVGRSSDQWSCWRGSSSQEGKGDRSGRGVWLRAAPQSFRRAVVNPLSARPLLLSQLDPSTHSLILAKDSVLQKRKALNPLRRTGPSVPAWPSVPKQAHPLLLVRPHLYPSSKNKMQ